MGNIYHTGVWVSDRNYDVFDRRLGKSMVDREIRIAEPYRRIGSGAMKNNIKMKRWKDYEKDDFDNFYADFGSKWMYPEDSIFEEYGAIVSV